MAKGKIMPRDWGLLSKTEREYQYVAIDLALQNVQRFSLEEVVAFKAYVPQKRGGTVWMLGENFWVVGGVASDWIANDFALLWRWKFLESACCAEFTVDVERKDQSGLVEKGDYLW